MSILEEYGVYVGNNILMQEENLIKSVVDNHKVLVIYDKYAQKNLQKISDIVDKYAIKSFYLGMTCGENLKSFTNYKKLLTYLADNNFLREDIIIYLGGGTLGDLVGFVSATYMRGINYIAVPTTLLSAVDSSVGGKVGIDMPNGKNLVGAFYNPLCVFIDTDIINHLPNKVFFEGFSEIIKYALLDRDIYLQLQKKDYDLKNLIVLALSYKLNLVKNDKYDFSDRRFLNLGHTFAHAIECKSGYSVSHGEALRVGLYYAVELSKKCKLLNDVDYNEIVRFLSFYNINNGDYELADLIEYFKYDKKQDNCGINLILLSSIGKPTIKHFTFDKLKELI